MIDPNVAQLLLGLFQPFLIHVAYCNDFTVIQQNAVKLRKASSKTKDTYFNFFHNQKYSFLEIS